MKRRMLYLLAFLLLLSTAAAAEQASSSSNSDVASQPPGLIGTWEIVSCRFEGELVSDAPGVRYIFSESEVKIVRDGATTTTKLYSFDPENPLYIDFAELEAEVLPPRKFGAECRTIDFFSAGIYKTAAGELTICVGMPASAKRLANRPTEFAAGEGHMLFVFRRLVTE